MWEVKLIDFSNRQTIGVTTLVSTETKRVAHQYIKGYKNVQKVGRTYYIEKGGKGK